MSVYFERIASRTPKTDTPQTLAFSSADKSRLATEDIIDLFSERRNIFAAENDTYDALPLRPYEVH